MDSKIPLSTLQVDGGMTGNNLLMQLQADIVGIPVGKISNIACNSDNFCIDNYNTKLHCQNILDMD